MVKCVRNIDPIPKIVVRFYSFSISMIFDAFEIDAVWSVSRWQGHQIIFAHLMIVIVTVLLCDR